ncbi:hypothetical protein GCM10023075_73410 [Streptosporangium album]
MRVTDTGPSRVGSASLMAGHFNTDCGGPWNTRASRAPGSGSPSCGVRSKKVRRLRDKELV